MRGAAGAVEVYAELHCCGAQHLCPPGSYVEQAIGLLWPCPLVVPPQGVGGTAVAQTELFHPGY